MTSLSELAFYRLHENIGTSFFNYKSTNAFLLLAFCAVLTFKLFAILAVLRSESSGWFKLGFKEFFLEKFIHGVSLL